MWVPDYKEPNKSTTLTRNVKSRESDVYTAGAVDNIDHNPSSQNAMASFHGTAISIMQFPTEQKPGNNRDPVLINTGVMKYKTLDLLPADYAELPLFATNSSDIFAPASYTLVMVEYF